MTQRAIIIAAAILTLIVLVTFSCSAIQTMRKQAAEARLNEAQSGAVVESGKDAIETQSTAGKRERESDQITVENEREIRNAKGSDQPIDRAVSDAGIASLCRRAAYRDSERCRLLRANP